MNHQTKVILGGFIGNVVEAYDISICYFLSNALAKSLLGDSKGQPSVILLLIFIAYLAKPIGAFFLGLCSDIYGRKNVLMFSILIMGLSTVLIGFIPSYQSIGPVAVFLLLSLRTIQSMALGSEFLNSASFLVESGDEKQRGFRGCWSSVGVKAGYLVACLVVGLMNYYVEDKPALQDWIWRLPFVLAIFTTLAGFYIRQAMPESLAYVIYYAERRKPSTAEIYKQTLRFVKQYPFMFHYAFFASFLSVATGFFFYLYIPLHAIEYSHLSRNFIMNSTMVSLLFVSLLIPVFGWYSDRADRLKMLTFASAGLLIMAYPFMHTVNYGSAGLFVAMQLAISIPCACYYSVSTVLLTELFPLQIRCTALSIVFSIAASLAAGLPPLLSDYLSRVTHKPNAPALIMIGLAMIVLSNIRKLYQRYRVGINQYALNAFAEDKPLFTIEYQK